MVFSSSAASSTALSITSAILSPMLLTISSNLSIGIGSERGWPSTPTTCATGTPSLISTTSKADFPHLGHVDTCLLFIRHSMSTHGACSSSSMFCSMTLKRLLRERVLVQQSRAWGIQVHKRLPSNVRSSPCHRRCDRRVRVLRWSSRTQSV